MGQSGPVGPAMPGDLDAGQGHPALELLPRSEYVFCPPSGVP